LGWQVVRPQINMKFRMLGLRKSLAQKKFSSLGLGLGLVFSYGDAFIFTLAMYRVESLVFSLGVSVRNRKSHPPELDWLKTDDSVYDFSISCSWALRHI